MLPSNVAKLECRISYDLMDVTTFGLFDPIENTTKSANHGINTFFTH